MVNKWSLKRLAIMTLAGVMLVSAGTAWTSQAAVPQMDDIRVAIFMQYGNYNDTTQAATLSSAGGMNVGLRQPDGIRNLFGVAAGTQVRFAADDYKVNVFESTNFASALAVFQRLQAAKGKPYLTSLSKNGATMYQVTEGTYKTSAEAAVAQKKWATDSVLVKLTGTFGSFIQGPFHLESAALGSKAAATQAASLFGAVGIDAFVAARAKQGTVSYSVMVGAAASTAELQIIKAAAAKASLGTSLQEADLNTPYMLIRNDHSITAKAESSSELYSFTGDDTKVWVSPVTADPIKLIERSNRTYRGQFELSVMNGLLTVVNELPFEQYLYSVVGTEMYASWPAEALKAQAVASRSYVLYKGFGFKIAHVVDTTLSQAYYGTGTERKSTIDAVNATAGEVVLYKGKVIETLYSANSGGVTADGIEAWNNSVAYLQSVKSPDASSEAGLYYWYRVVLPSGAIGYIRQDLLDETGQMTAAGSKIMKVNTNGTKVRKHPMIQDSIPVVTQVDSGTLVTVLEQTIESNSMSWVRGPYSSQEMLTAISAKLKFSGPIQTMSVSQRGPSGRATEILVNGQKLDVPKPDSFRGILGVQGSLPSTLFQIDETAKVAILGAKSSIRTKPESSQSVYTIGSGGKVTEATNANLFIVNGAGQVRASTKEPSFRFIGSGNGHGLGLSQYGALGFAQQGYDYQYILKYYYKDVTIAKE